MDKKSNVSSPVILLLSFLFIALESVRLFTGKQSAYFTDAILPAVWIAAYFLIIAVLLLACFLLCIRGMRRQWHHLLRIPLAMYFLYCLAVAGLILTTGYASRHGGNYRHHSRNHQRKNPGPLSGGGGNVPVPVPSALCPRRLRPGFLFPGRRGVFSVPVSKTGCF